MANAVMETVAYMEGIMNSTMRDIPKKNKQETAADTMTKSQYEIVNMKIVKELIDIIHSLKSESDAKYAELKAENVTLRKLIVSTRLNQEKSMQYENRDTLKICGIKEPRLPAGEFENTDNTVTKLFEKANIALNNEEINITHRLPGRDGTKPSAMLVKCGLRNVRNRIIRQKKTLKENEAFKTEYPGVFIVEHLTPLRSKVAYMLRQDPTIAKIWSIDGRLKVIKTNASPTDRPITIDSLAQLTRIGWTEDIIAKLVLEE